MGNNIGATGYIYVYMGNDIGANPPLLPQFGDLKTILVCVCVRVKGSFYDQCPSLFFFFS